ncbi:helix-turn-helix domain-containing protein [Desulfovibrio sp. JY]|nr:helix-turn-helix domain-containing protein [Desulfovibrio sp. JY]
MASLAQVVDIKGGVTVDKKRSVVGGVEVPYLRVANVQDGYIDLGEVKSIVVTTDIVDRLKLMPGDILLNEGGDRDKLGRGWVWQGQLPVCIHQNHVFRARPFLGDLSSKFLSFYTNAFGKKYFFDEGKQTTNLASISLSKLKALPVPIAPANEQVRIVSKIKELFTDLDKGEESLRRAQALLKKYRQSVLKAAVTGELTREWREKNKDRLESGEALLKRILKARREAWEKAELAKMKAKGKKPKDDSWEARYVEPAGPVAAGLPELPEGWTWASLGQLLSEPLKTGFSIKGTTVPPGVPSLKLNAIGDSRIDFSKVKYLQVPEDTVLDIQVREGDFFIARGNGSVDLVGRGATAQNVNGFFIYPDIMIRLRFLSAANSSQFVQNIWESMFVRKQIKLMAKTTAGIYKISQAQVMSIVIPIPPLDEQKVIAQRIVMSNELSVRSANEFSSILRINDSLRQSILKSAFTGKLVPQDPNDEPASELLKRIAAQKAAQADSRPRRATGPWKKTTQSKPTVQVAAPAAVPATPFAPVPAVPKRSIQTLAQLRKAASLSQAALAKAVGLNQAYISQMETGKRAVTEEQRQALAKALGVGPDALL